MASPPKERPEAAASSRASDMARAQRSAMALRLAASIKAMSPHALKALATDAAEAEPDAERESEDARAGHKTLTGRRRTPTRLAPSQQPPRTPKRQTPPKTPMQQTQQTPKQRTPERDDGSLSVLSSDASPSESVFEFLNSTDASGLALFTPPPQIQTRTTRSMSIASVTSSPGAAGSRHSSAASSPSQFFRSPVRSRKPSSGSSTHSKRHLTTPSPASARLNRTPRRPRSVERKPVEPLEVRIKEEVLPVDDLLATSTHAADGLMKQELTDDLDSLSPWLRLTTTPKRPASAVRTPSPSLKQANFPLSRRLKDAFDEAEVLDAGESRRNSLDGTTDDLFSAAPSGLQGTLSDHDSFFSFASSLSPLVNTEELEASFLSVRLSPMTSFGSYELPRLLPPFPVTRPEDDPDEEKAAATSMKAPNSQRASRGSNSSLGRSSATSLMGTSFPNIKASTSATPGKDQRSKLQSHSIMKTKLHSPFEAVPSSSTRDFQAINNSLKRKGQGRKRKFEEKRTGSNVQRKLLHTPVKASPLHAIRSPLHPLNGRMPHRSINPTSLPSLDEDEDEGRTARDASSLKTSSSAGCVQQLKLETPVKTPSSHQSKKRKAPGSPESQYRLDGSTPKLVSVLQHRKTSTSSGYSATMPVIKTRADVAPSDSIMQPSVGVAVSTPKTPMVLPMQTPVKEAVAQACVPVPPIITATKPKKAPCNCKKSKCLKLYCECFASGGYCDESCNCVGCSNTPAMEAERQEAINARLEKNPNAFKPKIEATALSPNSAAVAALTATTAMMAGSSSSHVTGSAGAATFLSPLATQRLLFHNGSGGVKKMHKNGCHCKKSACQKKYCECFQAGVPCGDNCRCIDCKNKAPCAAHASPAMSSVSAMTPSREIDEAFVSPVLQGVRKRLRIDRETWAKNFSSPYESSPTSLRERTERFRSRLQAVTHATTPLKAVVGPSATLASSTSSSGGDTGPLSVRLKPIPTPVLSTPVRSTAKRARLNQGTALSPLSDAAPRATSDAIISSNKSREQSAVVSLAGSDKLRTASSNRVFVLPLFGDKLPPLRMSVSAQIFRFLTNSDLHNASLVSRLWSQVALGDSVWDHANFVPAGSSEGEDQGELQTSLVLRASTTATAK